MEAKRLLVAVASRTAVALAAPGVAAAITYTVARADDSDGMCPSPDNCSLRQAIDSANATNGSDRIVFDIPPGGPQTIRPLASNLPPVTEPVEIDGTTQPGYAGAPVVELNGSLDPMLPNYGLEIQSGYSTIRGPADRRLRRRRLAEQRRPGQLRRHRPDRADRSPGDPGDGDPEVNVQVQGNLIGTDSIGTRPLGNTFGVTLITSSGAEVGGGSTSARNVIADNQEAGVFLETQSSDNAVQGNWIGVGADGRPLGNHGDGVFVGEFAHTNLIGGTGPGQGNLIAFNGGRGVALHIDAGLQNGILANSIHSNGSLGIDLLGNGGENPNDPGDADPGPNDLQNWPLRSSSRSRAPSTRPGSARPTRPGSAPSPTRARRSREPTPSARTRTRTATASRTPARSRASRRRSGSSPRRPRGR
jgi:hypothetical protein